jgi:hypothetical protein
VRKTIATIIFGLGILISTLYGQMPGSMSPPDFNAEKAAGIYLYDIEKVIKKLKIIDDSAKVKISESLIEYNNIMYDLSVLHSATFQKLEADFDRNVQIAMRNRDRNQMNGVKAEIQRIIPPIRMQVQEEEKLLNDVMANYINEKTYKKWLRYQEGMKS